MWRGGLVAPLTRSEARCVLSNVVDLTLSCSIQLLVVLLACGDAAMDLASLDGPIQGRIGRNQPSLLAGLGAPPAGSTERVDLRSDMAAFRPGVLLPLTAAAASNRCGNSIDAGRQRQQLSGVRILTCGFVANSVILD